MIESPFCARMHMDLNFKTTSQHKWVPRNHLNKKHRNLGTYYNPFCKQDDKVGISHLKVCAWVLFGS